MPLRGEAALSLATRWVRCAASHLFQTLDMTLIDNLKNSAAGASTKHGVASIIPTIYPFAVGVGKTVQAIAFTSCYQVMPPRQLNDTTAKGRSQALQSWSVLHSIWSDCSHIGHSGLTSSVSRFLRVEVLLVGNLQEEWPLLVIVPAAMRLVWAEELEKWLPSVRPSRIHVIESKADRLQVRRS